MGLISEGINQLHLKFKYFGGKSMVKKADKPVDTKQLKPAFSLLDYVFTGLLVLIGLIVIVSGAKLYNKNAEFERIMSVRPRLEQQLAEAKSEKPKVVIEKKKQKLMNARKAGQELVDAEKVFALKFFPNDETKATDYNKRMKQAESVVNKYLISQNKEFSTNPWLQNLSWKLNMETIVNFATEDAPIIFTMTNDQGDLMGIVTSSYDGHNFNDVKVKYTVDGIADSTDTAGK